MKRLCLFWPLKRTECVSWGKYETSLKKLPQIAYFIQYFSWRLNSYCRPGTHSYAIAVNQRLWGPASYPA